MKASVVVATKNRKELLAVSLKAMLSQSFPKGQFEVIVTDDGSTDCTKDFLEKLGSKSLKKIFLKESKGPAFARNCGIEKAAGQFVIVMDDDSIPEKKWLKELLKPFSNPKVGIVSSFNYYGGTSTAYRGKLLKQIGGFDNEFPTNYREDTDTIFKILDLGFEVKMLKKPFFEHRHVLPKTLSGKLKYGFRRICVHSIDALLYRKHPERTRKFLDIKFGFLRNPIADFKTATGLWSGKGKLELSSPQNVVFLKNESFLHFIAIIALGVLYVLAVKAARLYGSLKYGKLLL